MLDNIKKVFEKEPKELNPEKGCEQGNPIASLPRVASGMFVSGTGLWAGAVGGGIKGIPVGAQIGLGVGAVGSLFAGALSLGMATHEGNKIDLAEKAQTSSQELASQVKPFTQRQADKRNSQDKVELGHEAVESRRRLEAKKENEHTLEIR